MDVIRRAVFGERNPPPSSGALDADVVASLAASPVLQHDATQRRIAGLGATQVIFAGDPWRAPGFRERHCTTRCESTARAVYGSTEAARAASTCGPRLSACDMALPMTAEQREEWKLRVRGTVDGGWASPVKPAGWFGRHVRGRRLKRGSQRGGVAAACAMPDLVVLLQGDNKEAETWVRALCEKEGVPVVDATCAAPNQSRGDASAQTTSRAADVDPVREREAARAVTDALVRRLARRVVTGVALEAYGAGREWPFTRHHDALTPPPLQADAEGRGGRRGTGRSAGETVADVGSAGDEDADVAEQDAARGRVGTREAAASSSRLQRRRVRHATRREDVVDTAFWGGEPSRAGTRRRDESWNDDEDGCVDGTTPAAVDTAGGIHHVARDGSTFGAPHDWWAHLAFTWRRGFANARPGHTYDGGEGTREDGPGSMHRMPKGVLCPITGEPMNDPVMSPAGHSYERRAVAAWLEGYAREPLTGQPCRETDLRSNLALRAVIVWLRERGVIVEAASGG